MIVAFREQALERMETEIGFTGGFPLAVASAYRGRIQLMRAAPGERAMLPLRSLRLEPHIDGRHSLHVTEGWQLIVAFEDGQDGRVATVEEMIERPPSKKTEEPS